MWKPWTCVQIVFLVHSLVPPAICDEDINYITGGLVISVTQAPHQVAIYRSHVLRCGGAIVAAQWILTTGRCVTFTSGNPIPLTELTVRAGTNNANELGEFELQLDGTFVHDRFSYLRLEYDIGLVRLAEPVLYSNRVHCIKMAPRGVKLVGGELITVSGYGYTAKTEPNPGEDARLRIVDVLIVDHEDCHNRYEELRLNISDVLFCAGVEGRGTCDLDVGGPAVYQGELVGVDLGFSTCGDPTNAGVFTLVPAMRDWIDGIISSQSTHNPGGEKCL